MEFGSYRQPFELGKELEHEEEDKCHESYQMTKMSWRKLMEENSNLGCLMMLIKGCHKEGEYIFTIF